jgi:hypothetical protein
MTGAVTDQLNQIQKFSNSECFKQPSEPDRVSLVRRIWSNFDILLRTSPGQTERSRCPTLWTATLGPKFKMDIRVIKIQLYNETKKQTPWPESASEVSANFCG